MKLFDYINAIKFRFNKYPSHLILYVTARCNARCKHCFYWEEINSAKKDNELSLDEINRISKNLGRVKLLSITGGEPTLRSDLPQIVHTFHVNNKIDHVALHTNGFFSERTRDMAVQIVKENPKI